MSSNLFSAAWLRPLSITATTTRCRRRWRQLIVTSWSEMSTSAFILVARGKRSGARNLFRHNSTRRRIVRTHGGNLDWVTAPARRLFLSSTLFASLPRVRHQQTTLLNTRFLRHEISADKRLFRAFETDSM